MLLYLAKIFCLIALIPLVLLLVFPLTTYHFGFLSIAIASTAFLMAVTHFYRTTDRSQTRGGIVLKQEHPIQFLVSHLLLWLFGFGLLFAGVLGSLGLMK